MCVFDIIVVVEQNIVCHCGRRWATDLQKYIITNYFENRYYQNIDFVKQILKIYITFSTKEQHENLHYQYFKYRR